MGGLGRPSGLAGRLRHCVYRRWTGADRCPNTHAYEHGHERSARCASQHDRDKHAYGNADTNADGHGHSNFYTQRHGDCHQFADPDADGDSAAHHADLNADATAQSDVHAREWRRTQATSQYAYAAARYLPFGYTQTAAVA